MTSKAFGEPIRPLQTQAHLARMGRIHLFSNKITIPRIRNSGPWYMPSRRLCFFPLRLNDAQVVEKLPTSAPMTEGNPDTD